MTEPVPKPLARVLAGTDGSDRAEEAVRQAARLSLPHGASLDVVFVIDADRAHAGDVEREADDALLRAARLVAETGQTATTRVLAGDPAAVLVEEAAGHDADVICVGSEPTLLGGAIRVGAVATHVLRNAACSVLLARASGPEFPRIVECGIDGSDASPGTAALAATIANGAGAELRLLHVVPVFRGGDVEWILDPDESSPPEIEPSVLAAAARGITPIREMAMGRPEHALVAAAGRDEVDLLVVGHRGVRGVRRMVLGSVSEYCAFHAPCSVLVVRDRSGR